MKLTITPIIPTMNNNVAVLILAGGLGTRLGSNVPKGMFLIEKLNKTLFQIHVEKLKQVSKYTNTVIPLIIMTSIDTHQQTVDYFEINNYFDLKKTDVYFFIQNSIPMYINNGDNNGDNNDNIIKTSDGTPILSPNGNGDMYYSLISSGVYDKLLDRGIEYLQVESVDNILCKIADPAFFDVAKHVDLAIKVVSKEHDHEEVGVYAYVNNKLTVLEYTEISKELAEEKDNNGNRVYNCANIGSYVFRLCEIKKCIQNVKLPYHIAKKKINGVSCIKHELFIFDLFKEFNKHAIIKVKREEEYSPIKNLTGNRSPETAYNDYIKYIKNI